MLGARDEQRYQAYYCEENVWWLARAAAPLPRWAVFISNAARSCPLWEQKAGPKGRPVVWDYHVVLLTRGDDGYRVWDLDSQLTWPSPADRWLRQTFPRALPTHLAPRFRLVDGETLALLFASDRRHMLDEKGRWQAPPPPWPCIVNRNGRAHTLDAFVTVDGDGPGCTYDFADLQRWMED